MESVLLVEAGADGIVRLTMNRPQAHNALNPELTQALEAAVAKLAADNAVRAVVLTGAGEAFCAGGDVKAMREMVEGTREERMARSTRFTRLMAAIRALPVPVIARVNGAAHGGGAGLVAVTDIAIASARAGFGFTEPRLGIAPATISPYVIGRIGPAAARRVFLSPRRFDAAEGLRIGLYDRVVPEAALDEALQTELAAILAASRSALAACKALTIDVPGMGVEAAMVHTAERLADLWETDDAREGITAFAEKRAARWTRKD
ncbi:MAG: enoyl-CoA hydratase-related protein [Proteobacteria bacterium]|nr:enoyl-CoA hydratase-related protein [Pseudomonadota bacterium]